MDYQRLLELTEMVLILRGSGGSGNWAHVGRKGKRGGSGKGGGFKRIGVKPGAGRKEIKLASRQTRGKDKQGRGKKKLAGHTVSKTLDDAKKQDVSQDKVMDEIMKSNPPQQVTDGRMTKGQWQETYMSDEPKGFTLINVHPSAMNIPTAAGVDEKVRDFTGQDAKGQPPIVVDSNDKIEARHGGGKLDRAFGKQPHTVIDGKHRLAASQARSDKKLKAFVPKRKLDEIWKQSHAAEVRDFAEGYFKKKKFPVLEDRGDEWVVERNGREKTLNITAIKRIAAKLDHAWEWDN